MGKGVFTGTKYKDMKPLLKKMMPRFQEENWAQNQKLVDGVAKMAKEKGVTPAQMCLSWAERTCK